MTAMTAMDYVEHTRPCISDLPLLNQLLPPVTVRVVAMVVVVVMVAVVAVVVEREGERMGERETERRKKEGVL